MKKILGILIATGVLFLSGVCAFAMPEDVQDYIRVGITDSSIGSSYNASSSDGFAVYEYVDGEVILKEELELKELVVKVDSDYINLYETEDSELPIYSFDNSTSYFFGSMNMDNGIISLSGKSYRGGIMIYNSESAVKLINVINLEKYLYGVLPKEMSASYPLEALKAQAVAARSFAMGNLNKHKSLGFDICNTQDCQVYGGVSSEVAKCCSAVNETAGMVAYYNGKPVSCYYSANNGGYIENSEDIWGTDVGYLKAKKDEYNPEYNWTASFTTEKLSSLLESAGYSIGTVTGVKILDRTVAGSVTAMEFIGTNGKATINKSKIRSLLGSSTVKSLKFDITDSKLGAGEVIVPKAYTRDASGSTSEKAISGLTAIDRNGNSVVLGAVSVAVQSRDGLVSIAAGAQSTGSGEFDGIKLSGKGYGHGIGMSQTGAKAMADKGFDYVEILKYYFTGITVE